MKAFAVCIKTLREMVREPKSLSMSLLLPFAFLAIFGSAFGMPRLQTHELHVVLEDPAGAPLLRAIRAERYADGRPAFRARRVPDAAGSDEALKAAKIAALAFLGADRSGRPTLRLRGDATSARFISVSGLLGTLSARVAEGSGGQEVLRIVERPIVEAGPVSDFDVFAPGLIVFAMLLLIPQTAMLLGREVRQGTLRRLRLTRVSAAGLLGGVSAAQMVVATIQTVLIFLGMLAFGYHAQGSIGVAILGGLVLSFSAIGFGLLVAAFVKNDSQANGVGSAVAMIQVFLSGSFFAMPSFPFVTVLGHELGPFDAIPATHALIAMQGVLSYGSGLAEVGFRLAMALVLSLVTFAAGVGTFHRLQMR